MKSTSDKNIMLQVFILGNWLDGRLEHCRTSCHFEDTSSTASRKACSRNHSCSRLWIEVCIQWLWLGRILVCRGEGKWLHWFWVLRGHQKRLSIERGSCMVGDLTYPSQLGGILELVQTKYHHTGTSCALDRTARIHSYRCSRLLMMEYCPSGQPCHMVDPSGKNR